MDNRLGTYVIQLGFRAFLQKTEGKSNGNLDRSKWCHCGKCLTRHRAVSTAKAMVLMVYVTR